jgi:hypothetical protein
MLEIQETYINETKDHIFGESPWIDTSINNRGELFRALQREYGRCISRVYVDIPEYGQPDQIGWVFEKRMQYEDSQDFYIRHVWVSVRERIEQ